MHITQSKENIQISQLSEGQTSAQNSSDYKNINRNRFQQDKISFEIKRHIAVLSEAKSGWCRELNIVVWNDGPERYDIRDWNPEHTKMGRGICLNEEEVNALLTALNT